MTGNPGWPQAAHIGTRRLTLEPLLAEHAPELAEVLDDVALHEFIGGRPLTEAELRERYIRLETGRSPEGTEGWLNWVVRARAGGKAVGTLQATLTCSRAGSMSASLAWVIASRYQGRRYATEAAAGMADWLGQEGVSVFVAWIHPEHGASVAVARHLRMLQTDVVLDGETRWVRTSA